MPHTDTCEVKSKGELLGKVSVNVPDTIEDGGKGLILELEAIDLSQDEAIKIIAQTLREDATNNARSGFLQKDKHTEKANALISKYAEMGMGNEEIKQAIDGMLELDLIASGLAQCVLSQLKQPV
jgi:uncharacterized protein YoaH (UPF0181 family)